MIGDDVLAVSVAAWIMLAAAVAWVAVVVVDVERASPAQEAALTVIVLAGFVLIVAALAWLLWRGPL
jgi:hypothetical protein